MVRKFWRSFALLALILCLFSLFSWLYIVSYLQADASSHAVLRGLVLSPEAPSIWNLVSPPRKGSFVGPVLVLLLQVWLTGGFYGSLIRANAGDDVNVTTWTSDGFRSFWRLLLWNLLWAAVSLVVLGISQALPAFGPAFLILVLVLRFLFLFGDVSLVAERDVRFALQTALRSLMRGFLAMIPFAVVLIILTDAGRMLLSQGGALYPLVVSLAYTVLTAWVLHMVTARYLFLSNWHERRGAMAAR